VADNLVIVESPAKARTINQYLGKDYLVRASLGHVRDLPKGKLGVDTEKNFAPHYVTLRSRARLLRELKALAKKAKRILIATDPDREGEAIGWHLGKALKCKGVELRRVLFHEITEKAVRDAVAVPGEIDMKLVDAQQARRVLDRLVGYSLSPFLWKHVKRGLSAGRVQSVALRLVAEREAEIAAFKPEEYWELSILLQAKAGQFSAKLSALEGKKLGRLDGKAAQSLAAKLPSGAYRVAALEKKEQRRHPAPPFNTSALQQEASRRLRFSAKKTMQVAQQLYEGVELGPDGAVGLITYMRTDSVRVSKESQAEAKALILARFGPAYAPPAYNAYKARKDSQDAHEAVRPTSVKRDPPSLAAFLTPEQNKLYRLVWTRFLASQMTSAAFEQGSAEVEGLLPGHPGAATFKASGSVLVFPGFLSAWGADEAGDDAGKALPELRQGEPLKYLSSEPSRHFTQAPPRYSDATLVKALEELGIGRPSTYAGILATIQERGYAERIEGGRYKPTELGSRVAGLLMKHFEEILAVGFTAELELQLDRVEAGELAWQQAVASFYGPFLKRLDQAQLALRR
jgi:DNA topoisomerase-1